MITKFLRGASLALIFLIPFIALIAPSDPDVQNPSTFIYFANLFFFPFITTKAFVFRIIVEILLAFWLLLVLREKRYAPWKSWMGVAVGLFVVVTLITDLAGLNPVRSIWSNFERMEGWLTIAHLAVYFLVTTSIFGSGEQGRRMWHKFFNATLIAASLVGIYGIFQLFDWADIHQGSTRIDASLGNAAYMAVYMLMHAGIAWYMAFVSQARRKKGLVWMYGILGLVFMYLLFETATRGTILGLAGGIMLALGLFALFGKGESKALRGVSAGVIILIIALGAGLVAAKNTDFVKSHETLHRLATISWSENKTQARGYIWPMAVKGIFESPKTAILGVGQENFNYVFNTNYDPRMWSQEQWFDRAHNVFLDWLVAGGLVGFLSYISLFVLAIWGVWKSVLTFKEKCLFTGLFVAYAIHNMFVFDNLASYILFFTMLGFVHTLTAKEPIAFMEIKDKQTENAVVMRDYLYFPAIVIGFIVVLYFINVRPMQANTRLITALVNCNSAPSAEYYARALKVNQYVANQEIREQLYSCAAGVLTNTAKPVETKQSFYTLALQEISNQVKATPNDARAFIIGGTFLSQVGDTQNATPLLERANELSPNKQSIMAELAVNYLHIGKTKEALDLLKRAYDSAPENVHLKPIYAAALLVNNQESEARKIFGDDPELFTDPRAISIYYKLKQYDRLIAIYKDKVTKSPNDPQYYASLAAVYLEKGDKANALTQLTIMKEKFPMLKEQIDAAIAQVRGQ